jgi:hypothetical protein
VVGEVSNLARRTYRCLNRRNNNRIHKCARDGPSCPRHVSQLLAVCISVHRCSHVLAVEVDMELELVRIEIKRKRVQIRRQRKDIQSLAKSGHSDGLGGGNAGADAGQDRRAVCRARSLSWLGAPQSAELRVRQDHQRTNGPPVTWTPAEPRPGRSVRTMETNASGSTTRPDSSSARLCTGRICTPDASNTPTVTLGGRRRGGSPRRYRGCRTC